MKKAAVIMMAVALVGSFAISGISSSRNINAPLEAVVAQDTTDYPSDTSKPKTDTIKTDTTKTDNSKK